MVRKKVKKLQIVNRSISFTTDLNGGAITDFHLINHPVNPLNFSFTKEQMPPNNKSGAVYQGHFICCPYWGPPSEPEIKKGKANHGDFANIDWQLIKKKKKSLEMNSISRKENMLINRKMKCVKNRSHITVSEKIKNKSTGSKPFNIVQHPTLAAPFLSNKTIVDCNATLGFNQSHYIDAGKKKTTWPQGLSEKGNLIDLRNPTRAYNSVFSFIVNPKDNYGWVTAYSPEEKLLIGYIWERKDYPWINIWRHWSRNKLVYLGIEFGTTGIHQPFKEIMATHPKLFGEKTISIINPGETITKSYSAFLLKLFDPLKKVMDVYLSKEEKIIIVKSEDGTLHFVNEGA